MWSTSNSLATETCANPTSGSSPLPPASGRRGLQPSFAPNAGQVSELQTHPNLHNAQPTAPFEEVEMTQMNREVLNGVSVDGVGVKLPIFQVNCSCLLWSYRRMRRKAKKSEQKSEERQKKRRKTTKIEKKKSDEKPKKGQFLRHHLHQPP